MHFSIWWYIEENSHWKLTFVSSATFLFQIFLWTSWYTLHCQDYRYHPCINIDISSLIFYKDTKYASRLIPVRAPKCNFSNTCLKVSLKQQHPNRASCFLLIPEFPASQNINLRSLTKTDLISLHFFF